MYGNSGYIGSRMSVRAAEAYDNGLKPLSKWTKKDLVEILDEQFERKYDFSKIKKDVLFNHFLWQSEWHHTGSFYNQTDFWGVDEDAIEDFSEEKYAHLVELSSKKVESPVQKEEPVKYAKVHYIEWEGTRNNPKKVEIDGIGTIKGDWFYNLSGGKKKVSGNWFTITKIYATEAEMLSVKADEDAAKKAADEAAAQKNAEKEAKKKATEQRRNLYEYYIRVHPDVSFASFSRSKKMQEEAVKIRKETGITYNIELLNLSKLRSRCEISREEYLTQKKELKEKFYPKKNKNGGPSDGEQL